MNTYDIRKVGVNEMNEKGYELFNASRKRYGAELCVSKEQWNRRINVKGQDFWLAIEKKTGVAQGFAINRVYNDYCNYVSMGYNPVAPKSSYPMYGLVFEMNRYYLEEKKLSFVLDGSRSLTEHSNIQPFLEEKFGFRKAYCDMKVYYKPLMGCIVKILFPFRKLIKKQKIALLLKQEAWARGYSDC